MDFRSFGFVERIARGFLGQRQLTPAQQRWRIRRRLTIGVVIFGAAMIVTGAVGLFGDKFTGELVYGGVTLISAVLTAYSTMATFDDKWHPEMPEGENPDG